MAQKKQTKRTSPLRQRITMMFNGMDQTGGGVVDKKRIFIPFSLLREGKRWEVGRSYLIKIVARETGQEEDGATFQIIDATSLEPEDGARRKFLYSDGGMFKT